MKIMKLPIMNRKNYIELYKISLSNLLRRYISSGQMEELIKLYGKDKLLSIVDYVQVVNDNLVIPSSDSEKEFSEKVSMFPGSCFREPTTHQDSGYGMVDQDDTDHADCQFQQAERIDHDDDSHDHGQGCQCNVHLPSIHRL